MLKRAAMAATASVALAACPLPFARRRLSLLARASWMHNLNRPNRLSCLLACKAPKWIKSLFILLYSQAAEVLTFFSQAIKQAFTKLELTSAVHRLTPKTHEPVWSDFGMPFRPIKTS